MFEAPGQYHSDKSHRYSLVEQCTEHELKVFFSTYTGQGQGWDMMSSTNVQESELSLTLLHASQTTCNVFSYFSHLITAYLRNLAFPVATHTAYLIILKYY